MSGADDLARGREAFAGRAWRSAYEALARADRETPLGADDLERLATAAHLSGRDDAFLATLERAHRAHLDGGATERAVRCAFWLGANLAERGELGQAGGWLGRARRLLEELEHECAEHGYLLVPDAQRLFGAGEYTASAATAARAVGVAHRHGDAELLALSLHLQGRARLRSGLVEEGLALLDEAMLAVAGGELSPVVTGIVYCSVISACGEVYALGRADEWTAALSTWCEAQPDLVPYEGTCRVHRSEILQLRGAWSDALAEARRASEQVARGGKRQAAAAAHYQQGEVHRLRGETAAAERAYGEARRFGREPQPGLALLRLAQGRHETGRAAVRRALAETGDRLKRTRLLQALVEIALAAGDPEEARSACRELQAIARDFGTSALDTIAAHTEGAVLLAEGDASAALPLLRRAWSGWQELGAPYETARVRTLMAQACRALGDEETAALELEAARETFEALAAAPDLARVAALARDATHRDRHGLTPRELEVLRLVAGGHTNKAIAARLELSQKTVDRHLSNIFDKLQVSSRTAAAAYAFEHGLL